MILRIVFALRIVIENVLPFQYGEALMNKVTVQMITDTIVERMGNGQLAKGVSARPDDMAWAALGLYLHGAEAGLVAQLRERLADMQKSDGSIPVTPSTPHAWWPTSLALLAWRLDSSFSASRKKAMDFLLANRGAVVEQSPIVGHDTTLHGWPWIGNTHSWVEPTSLALMALYAEGQREHPAVREAVAMMKNRRLADGGWNYGNTAVYDNTLLPLPECTGIALCAMRDELSENEAATSIAYLEKEYPHLNTPLSLGWSVMGLAAWGRRPADAEARVAEAYSLQERYGPYNMALIGLLAACLTDFPFELSGGAS